MTYASSASSPYKFLLFLSHNLRSVRVIAVNVLSSPIRIKRKVFRVGFHSLLIHPPSLVSTFNASAISSVLVRLRWYGWQNEEWSLMASIIGQEFEAKPAGYYHQTKVSVFFIWIRLPWTSSIETIPSFHRLYPNKQASRSLTYRLLFSASPANKLHDIAPWSLSAWTKIMGTFRSTQRCQTCSSCWNNTAEPMQCKSYFTSLRFLFFYLSD